MAFALRVDSLILLTFGALVILATHALITRSKLGLAIRAVAQDSETAQIMGMNFRRVVFDVTLAPHIAQKSLAGLFSAPHLGHRTCRLSSG